MGEEDAFRGEERWLVAKVFVCATKIKLVSKPRRVMCYTDHQVNMKDEVWRSHHSLRH